MTNLLAGKIFILDLYKINEFRKKLNKSENVNLINRYGLGVISLSYGGPGWLNELGSWIT